jgi:RNA polymerase sigma factor (sigma-70 family)
MGIFLPKISSEEELVRRCQKGNSSAQREVYNKFSGVIYAIGLRYMKEQYEAEEVLTGTFIKVFENISRFEGKGSFEGWIKKIAVNEALGRIRKKAQMYPHYDLEFVSVSSSDADGFQQLGAADLLKLVQKLPAGYSTVFNLYAIEGYSHKEIADQLGITESTSKSQLSRARALLQKYLCELDKVSFTKTVSHE